MTTVKEVLGVLLLLIDLADGRMELTAAVNVLQAVQQLLLVWLHFFSLSLVSRREEERVL